MGAMEDGEVPDTTGEGASQRDEKEVLVGSGGGERGAAEVAGNHAPPAQVAAEAEHAAVGVAAGAMGGPFHMPGVGHTVELPPAAFMAVGAGVFPGHGVAYAPAAHARPVRRVPGTHERVAAAASYAAHALPIGIPVAADMSSLGFTMAVPLSGPPMPPGHVAGAHQGMHGRHAAALGVSGGAGAPQRGSPTPLSSDSADIPAGAVLLRSAASSEPRKLGGSIAHRIRDGVCPAVMAVGMNSVNQALKGVVTARRYLAHEGRDICVRVAQREQSADSLALVVEESPAYGAFVEDVQLKASAATPVRCSSPLAAVSTDFSRERCVVCISGGKDRWRNGAQAAGRPACERCCRGRCFSSCRNQGGCACALTHEAKRVRYSRCVSRLVPVLNAFHCPHAPRRCGSCSGFCYG